MTLMICLIIRKPNTNDLCKITKMQPKKTIHTFRPKGLLRNRHIQTLLVSSFPRRFRVRSRSKNYRLHSQKELVCTPAGVRLIAVRTLTKKPARARVILLHGWEGCHDSNYLLGLGERLWNNNYETIRLNLRDHGESHYLNQELFHSCLLQEVVDAVRLLSEDSEVPVFLVGFSLGGNFMLRVATHAHRFKIPPQHVYAISPAIVPKHVMQALDEGWSIYHNYFRQRWRRSLQKKQRIFPDSYDFSSWQKLNGLGEMTASLVDKYTDYDNADDYFAGYSVGGNYLADLQVPVTLITAADDPVIPVSDCDDLPDNPCLTVEVHPHGGHCGFIADMSMQSWLEMEIPDRIEHIITTPP